MSNEKVERRKFSLGDCCACCKKFKRVLAYFEGEVDDKDKNIALARYDEKVIFGAVALYLVMVSINFYPAIKIEPDLFFDCVVYFMTCIGGVVGGLGIYLRRDKESIAHRVMERVCYLCAVQFTFAGLFSYWPSKINKNMDLKVQDKIVSFIWYEGWAFFGAAVLVFMFLLIMICRQPIQYVDAKMARGSLIIYVLGSLVAFAVLWFYMLQSDTKIR
jgi:hypothetical protein